MEVFRTEPSLLVGASVHDGIHPDDADRRHAGRGDGRIVVLVGGHVDARGGVGRRHVLVVQLLRLLPDVAQVRLPVIDLLFARTVWINIRNW